MREFIYFISFVSIPCLLYSGFRILFLARPPFAIAASLRLGLALLIFLGAVSLPRNPATFEKEYKETVGYSATRLTLQFATLDDAQKQQILREMAGYFSDTEKTLKVTQEKSSGKGGKTWGEAANPQSRFKTWHDTIPNRYRWQENQLTIVTGRPLEDDELETLEAALKSTIAQENHSHFAGLISQPLQHFHLERKVQFRP